MRLLSFLSVLLMLMSCSNKDESVSEGDQETSPLTIISYSPTIAFIGDEVTIIAENIDVLETYRVSFNGAIADSLTVTENEFKVRIPEVATSGDIAIDYLDFHIVLGSIEITPEVSPLTIISYSPTSAFTGDEVTILAEGIDTLEIYSISFNGEAADSVTVTENEFKVKVPEGATSGDISIVYNGISIVVGTINIIETSDKLYYIKGFNDFEKLVEINLNTGNDTGEEYFLYQGDGSSNSKSFFENSTNTFYYNYNLQYCGQCFYRYAAFFNLETKEKSQLLLYHYFYGEPLVERRSGVLSNNNFYFTEYNIDNAQGIPSFKFRAMKVETGELRDVYEFSEIFKWNLENSAFINATTSLFSFTKDENEEDVLFKFDLTANDFSVQTVPEAFDNLTYSISDNKIFGTRELSTTSHNIVEINSTSGHEESIIHTIPYRVVNLDFSEDSNRFFALVTEIIANQHQYYIYRYDLETNNSTVIVLSNEERARTIFLDY